MPPPCWPASEWASQAAAARGVRAGKPRYGRAAPRAAPDRERGAAPRRGSRSPILPRRYPAGRRAPAHRQAIMARFSRDLGAPLGSADLLTIQPSSMRRLSPSRPSIAALASPRPPDRRSLQPPEGEAEEFQLRGRGAGAFAQQLQHAGAHLGIVLVGQQLEPVVQRADRREQDRDTGREHKRLAKSTASLSHQRSSRPLSAGVQPGSGRPLWRLSRRVRNRRSPSISSGSARVKYASRWIRATVKHRSP